jgi:hypothetical protein
VTGSNLGISSPDIAVFNQRKYGLPSKELKHANLEAKSVFK